MEEENINKIVEWIKKNSNYSIEQLRQAALQNGVSEEDFDRALKIIQAPMITLNYKGVGVRFIALIIDTIFFGFLFFIFTKLFPSGYICNSSFYLGLTFTLNQEEIFYGLCGFSAQLYFLIILTYYILMEWKVGGTVGKIIMGIKVVKTNGDSLDLKSSIIRNIMRIVDFLPFFYLLGAISIWLSKTKQRIGDRVAKTVIISKNK